LKKGLTSKNSLLLTTQEIPNSDCAIIRASRKFLVRRAEAVCDKKGGLIISKLTSLFAQKLQKDACFQVKGPSIIMGTKELEDFPGKRIQGKSPSSLQCWIQANILQKSCTLF
jgi:hypothetical protein